MISDEILWWSMVSTAVAGAAASLTATILDRRDRPARRARFWLHMTSYALMSISVFIFALRGLLATP